MEEDYYDYGGDTAVASGPPAYDPRAPQLGSFQPWDPRAPQINIPQGEVDWDYVNKAVMAQQRAQAMQMRRAEAKAKAEQEAVRFRGNLKFNDLIKGGATPQEAYRLAGSEMFYQDPSATLQASKWAELPTRQQPKVVEIDGLKFVDHGNRMELLPGQFKSETEPKLPEADRIRRSLELDALKRDPVLQYNPTEFNKKSEEVINKYEGMKGSKPKSPSAPPEGTKLRKGGKLYIVRNGKPEPIGEK